MMTFHFERPANSKLICNDALAMLMAVACDKTKSHELFMIQVVISLEAVVHGLSEIDLDNAEIALRRSWLTEIIGKRKIGKFRQMVKNRKTEIYPLLDEWNSFKAMALAWQ